MAGILSEEQNSGGYYIEGSEEKERGQGRRGGQRRKRKEARGEIQKGPAEKVRGDSTT